MKNTAIIIGVIAVLALVGAGVWVVGRQPPDAELPIEVLDDIREYTDEVLDNEALAAILARAEDIGSVTYNVVSDEFTGTFWQKDGKIRVEGMMDSPEGKQETVMIADSNTKTAYVYFPASGYAIETEFANAEEAFEKSITEASRTLMDYDPVIVSGAEMVDGKECVIVEFSVAGEEIRMWIWKAYGIPVQAEGTLPDGTVDRARMENFDFSDIPDSMFELPEGVELMDMPPMGQEPPSGME